MEKQTSASKYDRKLPLKVKIGFGAGGYASSIFFLNFVFYGMYFFTDFVGISAATAGLIVSIGAVWDAITDPLVGYFSDKRDPKKGRRRPFLLWSAIPHTIFTFLIFFNFGMSKTAATIYFTIITLGAYTFQTMIDIPYTSLGAELTTDYSERSSLNTYRNLFWNIGMFFSCAFLMFVDFFTKASGGNENAGWAWTSLVNALPIAFSCLAVYYTTKGYERTDIKLESEKFSFRRSVIEPLKNKSFRWVAIVFLLSIVAQSINNAVGLYYFVHYLGLDPAFASLLFVISAVIGFGDSWLIGLISRKTSKKTAWSVAMGSWAFSTLFLVMFILQPGAPTWMLIVFVIFNGLGLNTQYQVAHSMIPDSIEVEEFKTGERREGAYYGLTSLIQKVGASITMAVAGFVLDAIGYDGAAEVHSAATLSGIKLMFGLGCGIFLLLSIILVWLNPMTEKRHMALTKAIQDKQEGKEVDTTEFEALL